MVGSGGMVISAVGGLWRWSGDVGSDEASSAGAKNSCTKTRGAEVDSPNESRMGGETGVMMPQSPMIRNSPATPATQAEARSRVDWG